MFDLYKKFRSIFTHTMNDIYDLIEVIKQFNTKQNGRYELCSTCRVFQKLLNFFYTNRQINSSTIGHESLSKIAMHLYSEKNTNIG